MSGLVAERGGAPPLVVLGGATATGKTAAAIALAEQIVAAGAAPVAEIVSADSRQVYRGMDIGTAKATPADRARVVHHGLDLVEPDEPFSVADYVRHVDGVLAGLAARSGVAVLAGGTGLYLRAVGRGMDFEAGRADAEVRARLEAELERDGLRPLVQRLREADPARAAAIDLRNPRRVVRALESALLGGGPPPPPRGYPGPVLWLGLTVEPVRHRAWIAARARGQFEAGLVDEAAALRGRFPEDLRAFSGIGYREAFGVLDGRLTLDTAIAENVARNVRFARHQATWFRAEPGIEWVAADQDPTDALRRFVLPFLELPSAHSGDDVYAAAHDGTH